MNMKLNSLILGILFSISLQINAQKIEYGFVVGSGIANYKMISKPDSYGKFLSDALLSYNANVFIRYKTDGIMSVSIEPGYILKGGSYNLLSYSTRFKLNYIQVPLIADFYISDKFFLTIGSELSYLIVAKHKPQSYTNFIKDYDNYFELSAKSGVGYKLTKNIDVGLRYTHGLTYLSRDVTINTFFEPENSETRYYNQYFQLLLMFKI